jgi:ADP-ribosylglycohydrolase
MASEISFEAPRRNVALNGASYRDKVLGCWHGKNIGGTLGGPLEEKFGRDELFDVDWYPELPEGGIPNDDIELQLLWLQAIQEKGPGINARQLADYWLDCVRYNFDEYGLSKANLVRGLCPPVSGWHNNWFRDCMGSPIRSEIWACIAPAAPEIAARYAFEDAICDHGGGESVFGEVFNAVMQSCAFVESDKTKLIEAGLSAIPRRSLTYRAVARALALFQAGVEWKAARNLIKDEFFLSLAQYSPINLGFQTIGFLYGTDFPDAICKAVNCGWDTDCTGATVGATLGIILGARQLPPKWVAPLKDEISTNLPNGGIRHLRAPTDVNRLTDEVCALAPQVLHYWNSDTRIADQSPDRSPPLFRLDSRALESYDPGAVLWNLETIDAAVHYHEHAAIFADLPRPFSISLRNTRSEPVEGTVRVNLPAGWTLVPAATVEVKVAAGQDQRLEFTAQTPASAIEDVNRGTVEIALRERPALPSLPLVLIGGYRWLVSPVHAGASLETVTGWNESQRLAALPQGWGEIWRPGNNLEPETLMAGQPGIIYLAHFIESPIEQEVIRVSNTGRMKLWLKGRLIHQTKHQTGLRPNQGNGGGDAANYSETVLIAGNNQVLIKLERGSTALAAHFTLGRPDRKYFKCLGHSVLNLQRSRTPWDAAPL